MINIITNGYNDYKVYCYYSSDVLLYCVIRLFIISEQFWLNNSAKTKLRDNW